MSGSSWWIIWDNAEELRGLKITYLTCKKTVVLSNGHGWLLKSLMERLLENFPGLGWATSPRACGQSQRHKRETDIKGSWRSFAKITIPESGHAFGCAYWFTRNTGVQRNILNRVMRKKSENPEETVKCFRFLNHKGGETKQERRKLLWVGICPLQNPYVEILTPFTAEWTLFGDRDFAEIIRFK